MNTGVGAKGVAVLCLFSWCLFLFGCRSSGCDKPACADAGEPRSLAKYESDVIQWLQDGELAWNELGYSQQQGRAKVEYSSHKQWLDAGRSLPWLVPVLITLLSSESTSVFLPQVASVLGELDRDKCSVFALYRALGSKSAYLRSCAVCALGQLGARESVAAIVNLALHDLDPIVRVNAFKALRLFGDKELEGVFSLGRNDPDPMVRTAASR